METTHSKTRRTKGSSSKIVVQSWDKVWDSFNKAHSLSAVEEMNAEGWKTISQASKESGVSESRLKEMAKEGKLERVKKSVWHGGSTREINFIRPKTTTCQ
jgi:hypothetical protein